MNTTFKNHGKFVISLDFELAWGMWDKGVSKDYQKNILAVRQVLPKLLDLFDQYGIKATFATVGFLFFEDKNDLINGFDHKLLPSYSHKTNPKLIDYILGIGDNETTDPYHFGFELIQKIKTRPHHEIATHTFSHYYCLEEGQTIEQFEADIRTAKILGQNSEIAITSLVFPRNQYNPEYLDVCIRNNLTAFRGNESSWLYAPGSGADESQIRRALRLADAYINLSGHNCYSDDFLRQTSPVNIPSSRFLRPFSKKLSFLENLRAHRIKKAMTVAAKTNKTFHLWWHPHNFGKNTALNFSFLKNILEHYSNLQSKHNFTSYTMREISEHIKPNGDN